MVRVLELGRACKAQEFPMPHFKINGSRFVVGIAVALLLGTAAHAAKEPPAMRVIDPMIYKVMQYSFPYPDEHYSQPGAAARVQPQQLGAAAPSASPGTSIGVTWYDYQHNGTMGRMNETGTGASTIAHFSWMFLAGPVLDARKAVYDNYDITLETFGTEVGLQGDDQYAGYVNLNLTNNNRGIVGAHNKEPLDGRNDPSFYWDFAEGSSFFGGLDTVPSNVSGYAGTAGQEVIWPKFAYSEGTSDTVLHVIAQVSEADAGDPQANYYFRRPSSDANPGPWDFPPRVIDTAFDLSHAVEANDAGKVVLAWTANIPCNGTDPDTASCNAGVAPVQWNNDIYYQISTNHGVTWAPRVNLTKNRKYEYNNFPEFGQDSYRPYTDLGVLLDGAGNFHVVWGAAFWSGTDVFFRNRIFHWSENQPYIRTAHSADWDQTDCNGGAWQLNASKMSVSECNGRLYLLFVQFNDGAAGIFNDCADEGNPGFPSGSANGDLYVTVSEDGGLTWDLARNITNSRTPGCDSVGGVGGPCDSDHWPSISRFGTDVDLTSPATAEVIPAGGSNTGFWLDVQYINDHSAGGIVQNEGTWQQSDVRWFRLGCVAAVTAPNPLWTPTEIAFPEWTKAGVTYNKNVVVENLGNANYTYSTSQIEPTVGPISNWLSISNFDGQVNFGVNNTETGTVTITPTGAVAGNIYHLVGGLVFTGNNASSPDTFDIDFIVADTIIPPELDTITTACLALVVGNNGAMGDEGIGKVNMDYYTAGDCDTNAQVYLYSGSPVISWIDGTDTIGNWSLFGNSYLSDVGFYPLTNSENFDTTHGGSVNDTYRARFVVRDSSIGIEQTLYAPKAKPDSCNFIIQKIKIYSRDGASHSGLTIGESIDWDVPSDSGSNNGSDFDAGMKMIWQYGGEYHQDDTGANAACQDNDVRIAAMAFLAMQKKAATWTDVSGTGPYGAYTLDNATWVYGNDLGFLEGEQYQNMATRSGYSVFSSVDPDSAYVDLHSTMTFVHNYTLPAAETLIVYIAKITLEDETAKASLVAEYAKALGWLNKHVKEGPLTCCVVRGDLNHNGGVNVADLTFLVNRLFKGGPAPVCLEEGNVNNDAGNAVNVADLTFLVNRLFKGGPAPAPCD
jgi:hypothetical protein